MSDKEVRDGREEIVRMDLERGVASIAKPGTQDSKDFTFDAVYDSTAVQEDFYNKTAGYVVEKVLEGFNGTIFAYGQTGTGKTHTMVGVPQDPNLAGVIPRTFEHIFESINTSPQKKFLVRASYLEIYNEEIRDLLSKNPKAKLDLKDHPDGGVFVKDLSQLIVKGVSDLEQVMDVGQKNRSVACTLMNSESSRSHSIFTVTIETAETGVDGKDHIRVGKMNMVDLAGSERQSKTGASGDVLKEATKINMSLSALGNVISALVDAKSSFIPYRDSKLTRLLQDSLGGNTKTVMCACIGPVDYNYDETLSTLRYAYRAKSIKNKPKINEDPKDAMIREFQDEIAKLREQLMKKSQGGEVDGADGAAGMPRPRRERKEKGPAPAPEVIVEVETVEKVVEVVNEEVVEKVVQVGISEEQLAEMEREAEEEARAIEEKFNQEAAAILANTDMAEQKKAELVAQLEAAQREREAEAEAQKEMAEKLKSMQALMLQGTQVMEKAMQQEQELTKAEAEETERKRQEERLREELEAQKEMQLDLEEKYASAEEQAQKMVSKLEKLYHRHKQTQTEIADLKEEFQQEREDMLDTIRELRKEVKLVCLTIENFIPMDQYQQITDRARYDEGSDEWEIAGIHMAGNKMRPNGRPIDEYAHENGAASPGALLRGSDNFSNGKHAADNSRPNVYFAYTEDGGAQRSERPSPSPTKPKRTKSAGRPGTASRTGRAVKSSSTAQAPEQDPRRMNHLMHSQMPQEDMTAQNFPKARGLVRH